MPQVWLPPADRLDHVSGPIATAPARVAGPITGGTTTDVTSPSSAATITTGHRVRTASSSVRHGNADSEAAQRATGCLVATVHVERVPVHARRDVHSEHTDPAPGDRDHERGVAVGAARPDAP